MIQMTTWSLLLSGPVRLSLKPVRLLKQQALNRMPQLSRCCADVPGPVTARSRLEGPAIISGRGALLIGPGGKEATRRKGRAV